MDERSIGVELGKLNNLLRRQMACMAVSFEETDVTGMQAMIIHHLLNCKGERFQKDIETQFRIRRSTATGMLKLMEQHGLIRREPVEYDARLKRLALTDKARALDECIGRKLDHMESVMGRGIDKAELDTWFKVSRHIRMNLEKNQEHNQNRDRRNIDDT